jgi:cobalt-zinc-cadmium efflux system protein
MHVGHGNALGHPKSHGESLKPAYDRMFAVATALNVAIVVLELVFGVLAGSMALIADAVHNASDVASLLIAWGAFRLGRRAPTWSKTYGYGSASVLAALANAALLLVALGAIAIESVRRLWEPTPIESGTVVWVALAAIVINGATALLFWRGRSSDLNIRGAFLHMATDAAVSAGVVAGALLIGWTGWLWIDPVLSLAIVALIFVGAWGLMREAADLAMHAVPPNVDRSAVERYLAGLPGVTDVHDVHIWALSTTETALTAHLVRPESGLDDALLAEAAAELKAHYAIAHTTLQIECGASECDCALVSRTHGAS